MVVINYLQQLQPGTFEHAVQGQWQLYCLVHNIEKLANYGQLAA